MVGEVIKQLKTPTSSGWLNNFTSVNELIELTNSLTDLPADLLSSPLAGSDIDNFFNHFSNNGNILYIPTEIASELALIDLNSPEIAINNTTLAHTD